MKRFKEIIQSTVEPSNTNVLWLNPDIDELLYYSSNGWSPIYQDSSIIEPKSVRIERVETHIGKEDPEEKDRSYFLYKVSINPSSTNIPYHISWDVQGVESYLIISVDSKDNHYCKVFLDSGFDSIILRATITYGNKSIQDLTTVDCGAYLTINVETNLKGVDDHIFESLGANGKISILDIDSNSESTISFGETVPVIPNRNYELIIRTPLSKMYDFIGGTFNEGDETHRYSINTLDYGSYLTKTIQAKGRATRITYKYKGKILRDESLFSPMIFSDQTYSTVLFKWFGQGGFYDDTSYLSVRPYSYKDVVLVSGPLNTADGTGETTKDVVFEDILTKDFEGDYTEVTLEGFTLDTIEDAAIVVGNNLANNINSNNEVWTILANNSTTTRSSYWYFTKEEVAKITDIGTIFRQSNIKTFDQFQYFTGITELKSSAFQNCANLTSIIIPENISKIPSSCFNQNRKLNNIVLHDNITSLGKSAFSICSNITNINLPSKLTEIGDYCFQQCENLLNINIPSSVTTIGQYAFSYCSKLSNIDLPNSIKEIKEFAFSNSGITSLVLPNSISRVPNDLCADCNNLSDIQFPNSIREISERAFSGCSALTSVTLNRDLTKIGDYAFSNCTNLSTLNRTGGDLSDIGQYAFKSTKIQNLDLASDLIRIMQGAFIKNSQLESVTIGRGSQTFKTSMYARVFNEVPNLKTIIIKSTYYNTQPGISSQTDTFRGAADNGTIYVRSGSSGWESDPGIKDLLDNKGWTISYTL